VVASTLKNCFYWLHLNHRKINNLWSTFFTWHELSVQGKAKTLKTLDGRSN
jgi:hypothetical protein